MRQNSSQASGGFARPYLTPSCRPVRVHGNPLDATPVGRGVLSPLLRRDLAALYCCVSTNFPPGLASPDASMRLTDKKFPTTVLPSELCRIDALLRIKST